MLGMTRRIPLRGSVATVAVAVLFTLVSGCSSEPNDAQSSSGSPGSADEIRTVRFGQVGSSATLWPVYAGRAKGFFEDHGIEVTLSDTGSSAGVAQQIVAGAQDIGSAGLPDFVRAIAAGAPLQLVASGVAEIPYTMVGDKGIESWDDLKGKTVILGGPQDVTRYYFDAIAEAKGFQESDFTLTYAGATSARFAALSSGSVAAAILGPPFDARAVSAGDVNLGEVNEFLPKTPFTGLAASTPWAEENPEIITDFLRGYLDSIAWLQDDANRDEAIQILAEATNTPAEDAAATYDYYFDKIDAFSADGVIDTDAFDDLMSGLADAKFLDGEPKPADQSIDSQYVQAAAKNG